MNTRTVGAIIAVVAVLVISGVAVVTLTGGTSSSTTQSSSSTSSASSTVVTSSSSVSSRTTSSASTSIKIVNSTGLGSYLANSTDYTLYLFTNDTQNSGVSSCYGQCATFWTAFHGNSSSLVLPAGLNASSFGTLKRTDGTTQITYEGWPLYFYSGDNSAGQTNGQNKFGTWFVVNYPKITIPANATTHTTVSSSG
jgi:predicted lipoprotein with Yx(FWY)xxD motif